MSNRSIDSSRPNFPAPLNRFTFSLLLLACVSNPGAHARNAHKSYAQDTVQSQITQKQPPTILALDRPIERELSGSQDHPYQISLAAAQYARVVVEQRGVDLTAQLNGTNGESIAEFDFEVTIRGQEEVEVVAEKAGEYGLVVTARYPKLADGRYLIRLVEVREATADDKLLHESRVLQNASKRLYDTGKYLEALPLAEQALKLRERVRGSDHLDLYPTLVNLFVISFRKGDYTLAEQFMQRALTITQKVLGEEHPIVGRIVYNLAVISSTRGDDLRAEPLVQRALAIHEKTLGPDHPYVAHSLNRLAVIVRRRGDYLHAEPLFRRALLLSEKTLGEDHEDLANMLNTLAGVYRELGDYAKAEPLYQRAVAIYEKTRGLDYPLLSAPLNNLATLYTEIGDLENAESLYLRSIAIKEKSVGPNNSDAADSRCNVARLYYLRGDYEKAKNLYLGALPILEKALGEKHLIVGEHLNAMANVFAALGDYEKARTLYERSLSILEASRGPNHYVLADVLLGLSRLSAAEGKTARAVAFQSRANAVVEHNVGLNLTLGSERQKLAFLARLPEQLDQTISLHLRVAASDPTASELAATAILQRKGRVQDSLSNNLAALRGRLSTDDKALMDQLNDITARLAQLVFNRPPNIATAEYDKRVKGLEEERERLESEIGRRCAEFYVQSQPVSLNAVRSAIPPDAALIEMAVYRPSAAKPGEGRTNEEPRYIAYVIRNQGEVRWAELGAAKEVDGAIDSLRQALRDPWRKDVQQLTRNLDEKLMRPIRGLLGNATHLLVSPDGELNLLPFAALRDENGGYLIERYSFTYLTSGRDLLRMKVTSESRSNAMVVANPSFGESGTEQIASSVKPNVPKNVRRTVTAARSLAEVYFAPLNGTGEEAQKIHSLFPEASVLSGPQATESALKTVVAPRLLHIATHGFFLENDAVNARSTTGVALSGKIQNPLLRSGLALAGANRKIATGDDGILTALEASGLNLWGTRLLVLSACDTGLGEIRNGEGVYGLRRAFVLAGAESLVMSLWPVSDYSTRTLMTNYYQHLKEGKGRGESLRQVQLEMLKKNPKLHPFYWANFIQSGEWANLDGKR